MEPSTQWARDANCLSPSCFALYQLANRIGKNTMYGYFWIQAFDLRAPNPSSGVSNVQIAAQLKQRYYIWMIGQESCNGLYPSPSGLCRLNTHAKISLGIFMPIFQTITGNLWEHRHLIILEWNAFGGQHVFWSISIQSLKVLQVPG